MKKFYRAVEIKELLEKKGLTALQMRKELELDLDQYGWVKEENRPLYQALANDAVRTGEFCQYEYKSGAMHNIKEVHDFAVPAFQKELSKGFKLKSDGSLFAKDKARLDELKESICQRFAIKSWDLTYSKSNSTFALEIKARYQSGLSGKDLHVKTSQINSYSYIFSIEKNEPIKCEYTAHSQGDFLKAKQLLEIATEKQSEIQSKITLYKRILEC